ncbi:MAG: 16S rRNA (guanine(527)-N(7))-methyltransferase RsmG [Clostridiales bacterium]|nr:16S rRNA (guanine(527)-N(7))-methyltransferase RsmG [Clostridiales bacterium]
MIGEMVARGAAAMGIALPDGAAARFDAFHDMLADANRRFNLTRVPDEAREAVDRNYLDSLSPVGLKLLDGAATLLDLGSGAGFPGVPLAIALPGVRVTMVDALGKRVAFLREVIGRLNLNARALHARAEDAARDRALRDQFDAVTARAVAPLGELAELALPFARPGGVLLAYKGPSLDQELPAAAAAIAALRGRARQQVRAPVPGRDWDHRIAVIEKRGPTPPAFPRRAGDARRMPII